MIGSGLHSMSPFNWDGKFVRRELFDHTTLQEQKRVMAGCCCNTLSWDPVPSEPISCVLQDITEPPCGCRAMLSHSAPREELWFPTAHLLWLVDGVVLPLMPTQSHSVLLPWVLPGCWCSHVLSHWVLLWQPKPPRKSNQTKSQPCGTGFAVSAFKECHIPAVSLILAPKQCLCVWINKQLLGSDLDLINSYIFFCALSL